MGLNYTHLPAWLENNWMFRQLFLLRKLFIIKKRFHHHGQWAEDIALDRLFPKRYKGFFVDVGCFHPVKYNNTYRLYRKGWRGVNIDIDRIKIEGFDIVRPGDENIASAVSNQSGTLTYWTNGFYSLTITLDRDFAAAQDGYRARQVEARSLQELLDNSRYKGKPIDLLTVDAEGHDLQVLQSLDMQQYSPRIIAVETFAPDLEQLQADPLYQWLHAQGYRLSNWVGLTTIWKGPRWQELLQG